MYSSKGSRQVRFAVLGDIIVDKTVQVERLDRRLSLGDGTFLRSKSVETALGGIPTVARVLAAVGRTLMVHPRFNRGTELPTLERLLSADIYLAEVDSLEIDCQDWIAPCVTRFVERDFLRRDHQLFRVEERPDRTPSLASSDLSHRALQTPVDAFVVSDYGRGFITEDLCSAVGSTVQPKLILDPAGNWAAYRRLGAIHTVLLRGDQLADFCKTEGVDIDSTSAVDLRAGALHVLRSWPQVQNVVVKDHGTAETWLFCCEPAASDRLVQVYVLRKTSTNLRSRLGGGTAFTAYMTAALAVGLNMVDAALAGEAGALSLSLVDHTGIPALDDVYRLRREVAGLFTIDPETTVTIDGTRSRRDFL